MKKRTMPRTIHVPTLVDADGHRHIIPARDQPALCDATGKQENPREHKASKLCQRCVQRYMRALLDVKLGEVGL